MDFLGYLRNLTLHSALGGEEFTRLSINRNSLTYLRVASFSTFQQFTNYYSLP